MARWRVFIVIAALALVASALPRAAAPVRYRFTFPEPEHHWMQIEATFADVPAGRFEFRISRSSPGRYALHEFAKNVYDVHAYGDDGREARIEQVDDSGWAVADHGAAIVVKYRVFGDRVDGTYLGIDRTHAHVNMPAVIMWARGFDDRPVTINLEPPAGANWRVATQLHQAGGAPGAAGFEFTAPNLQYLMDSPIEFGPVTVETFAVGGRTFRFAVHHAGSEADVRGFVRDVAKVVQQEGAVFGEFPEYEPGAYTFLADYLPYDASDGMEHRNSTVMTSRGSIADSRFDLLDTVAHEFFHSWNVERIRPRDLEPFVFDRTNVSSDLWLAEGFTQYYGPLALARAGFADLSATAGMLSEIVDTAVAGPGQRFRSLEEMSRLGSIVDGFEPSDRTNWSIAYTSYYPLGASVALALDLSLRERSGGARSLDDFMREMWRRFGKPGGPMEGYVSAPYTTADAENALATVAADAAFARGFFDRFIRGRDTPDFAPLLNDAGFAVQKLAAGRAWLGDLRLGAGGRGVTVTSAVAPGWPLYQAGVDEDDEIEEVDGARLSSPSDIGAVLRRHRPGDRVAVTFVDRSGTRRTAAVVLAESPHVEVVPLESTGGGLSAAQRAFRQNWLGPK